jgi:hypothetical protein
MVRTLAAAALILASILMTAMPVYAEGFIDFYLGAAITNDSDQKVSAPGFSATSRSRGIRPSPPAAASGSGSRVWSGSVLLSTYPFSGRTRTSRFFRYPRLRCFACRF